MVIKQVVVIRRDLKMSSGLLAAQAAHISAQFLLDELIKPGIISHKSLRKEEVSEWLKAPTLTILAVETPEELSEVMQRAKRKGLAVFAWNDTIYSEILDTYLECFVGFSIGPDNDEKIKQVTGNLPLY
jgi:peptidyl-tRNA hydrolase